MDEIFKKHSDIFIISFKRRGFRWPKSQPFETETLKKKCFYLREVVGKKGAELHEGVVALVKKLAHQLEVILLRLLVDHAVALLGHQQHQRHSQVHLH
jgi:hypothetical protein